MALSNSDKLALQIVELLKRQCGSGSGQIQAFIRYSRQVEGWFKGELLKISAKMEDQGEILDFIPDCRIDPSKGKQNIDLRYVSPSKKNIWIELKHWYLGKYPSGANWTANTYFTQSTSATPNNFLRKLPADWDDPTYMLIATTPNPGRDDWCRGVERLRRQHENIAIRDMTSPEEYPDAFFLGLLRVKSVS